jgi:mono/diheme cytochrome c family protein
MNMPKIAVIISTVFNMFFAVSVACLWVGVTQPAIAQQKVASRESDSRQIERGRYLVEIGGCNDCHTAGYAMTGGNIPESQWLMGDKLGWRGPWGTTYPSNLRLLMNSLTQDQWVQLAKGLQTRPPMPWWLLHAMTHEDLKAMHAYVKWLGAAGEVAPSYVPPEQEPLGLAVQFPMAPKK